MTILSQQQLFSDAQAVTVTAPSDNHIDLGKTGTPPYGEQPLTRDIGKGTGIPLTIQVIEAFAGLTSLAVEVQVDTDPAFGTAETVHTSTPILAADLAAGYRFNLDQFQTGTDKRYLRLNYVVVGTATAGMITAGVSMGNQTNPN